MNSRKPHIEVILPIYNEVKNLVPLIAQLDQVKKQLEAQASLSLLFINDGSTDGSTELLHRLYRERNDVRVVNLVHNFGHGAALTCGLNYFSGDAAVLMDADQQDDPLAILQLFDAWKSGHKTVVAARGERKERGKALFQLFYFVLHKLSPTLPPVKFGTFSILDRSVVRRFLKLRERNRYFPGLIAFASDKITSVVVDRKQRGHGKSRVGLFGLVHLAITAFISFSNAPVRLVSILGLVAAGMAMLAGISIIAIKLLTPLAIPGWASIMTATAFWSGLQLLCLGII
ncbi:MAG: glycosyltransferase family 2 protein [Bdellovibrionota bacterium]